jgi:hypothetical protein
MSVGFRRAAPVALAVVVLTVFGARPAHAYLDGATGSMILQILVGAGAATFFMVKSRWRSLKARLMGRAAEPESAEPTESISEPHEG